MWNSIKNLFTGSNKEDKTKETQSQLFQELESYKTETEQSKQETEQYKIKFEAVVKEIRKLRHKTENQDEEIHRFRIKEQQQLTKEIEDKEELDSKAAAEQKIRNNAIKKEVMEAQMGRRNRHYNDFINWTFQDLELNIEHINKEKSTLIWDSILDFLIHKNEENNNYFEGTFSFMRNNRTRYVKFESSLTETLKKGKWIFHNGNICSPSEILYEDLDDSIYTKNTYSYALNCLLYRFL